MAKRIKRFLVFVLFSLLFSLLSGKESRAVSATGKTKQLTQTQPDILMAASCHSTPYAG